MSVGLMVVIVVGAIMLIVKRFRGEPIDARDTFVTPLILVGIGIYSVIHVEGLNGTDIAWLVLGAVVGIAFGAIRGTTTVLFARDGHLWQRYTVKTLVVWALSAVAGFGVNILGSTMGMHHDARPLTLSIGIGMLGEMLTLGLRALSTGLPFAPDKRSTSATASSRPDQGGSALVDRFLANLANPDRAQRDTGASPAPSDEKPNLDRSPTVRDGLDWLNQLRTPRR